MWECCPFETPCPSFGPAGVDPHLALVIANSADRYEIYFILRGAGSILLLHVGMLPLFETPCPSFGPAGFDPHLALVITNSA